MSEPEVTREQILAIAEAFMKQDPLQYGPNDTVESVAAELSQCSQSFLRATYRDWVLHS